VPRQSTLEQLGAALDLGPADRSAMQGVRNLAAQPPSESAGATDLRRQPTRLIGREADVQQVTGLLERRQVRLLTLTGPGGVGKTRLAYAVADRLGGTFESPPQVVELAPVHDPHLVGATIAHTLGLGDSRGASAREQLLDYLRARETLIVLDNFEHVIQAAPLLADLLASCRELRLLVTSRTALRLRAEQRYMVAPLATRPACTADGSMDELATLPAVQLFADRAQAIDSSFELDAKTRHAVAELCARLDGLPLAIELAAARVHLIPPSALLERLEQRLPMLTNGYRDAPARQQTLRATLDWSYEQLTESERTLFRRLGEFQVASPWTARRQLARLRPTSAQRRLRSFSARSSTRIL
jgi:predicted ATPase